MALGDAKIHFLIALAKLRRIIQILHTSGNFVHEISFRDGTSLMWQSGIVAKWRLVRKKNPQPR